LTGLTDADRCPECGTALSAQTLRLGERRRRPGLAWTGRLTLLLGLALVALAVSGALNRVDWYRYRPASWLVHDLTTPARPRAWAEPARLAAVGDDSPQIQASLTDRALQAQAEAAYHSRNIAMIDWLGQRCLDGALADAQKKRFFNNMILLALDVRPRVGPK